MIEAPDGGRPGVGDAQGDASERVHVVHEAAFQRAEEVAVELEGGRPRVHHGGHVQHGLKGRNRVMFTWLILYHC